jgi:hypothetical protein
MTIPKVHSRPSIQHRKKREIPFEAKLTPFNTQPNWPSSGSNWQHLVQDFRCKKSATYMDFMLWRRVKTRFLVKGNKTGKCTVKSCFGLAYYAKRQTPGVCASHRTPCFRSAWCPNICRLHDSLQLCEPFARAPIGWIHDIAHVMPLDDSILED